MPKSGQYADVCNDGVERTGIFVVLVGGRGDARRVSGDGAGERGDLRGLDAGQNIQRRGGGRDGHKPVADGDGCGLDFVEVVVRKVLADKIGLAQFFRVAGELALGGGLDGRDDGHQCVAGGDFLSGHFVFDGACAGELADGFFDVVGERVDLSGQGGVEFHGGQRGGVGRVGRGLHRLVSDRLFRRI